MDHPPLTPTEQQVLVLLSDALGVGVIASRMGTSESTVRTHIRHIQDKFGTFSMPEITRVAVLHELEGCCADENASLK